ncbi:MAG: glutathione synthase, partial [Deltaproteobacteria bacterium]|nr:glutathione synthase [Deltaproteobacteria bacterium]
MKLLVIVDPLERLGLAGDTSYALMLEAAARGWPLWTCQLEHLGLVDNDAVVDAVPTTVREAATPAEAFS